MAKSVVLHFRGREAREAKKVKDEQLSLRRGASRVAREVRGFWAKLNKVHNGDQNERHKDAFALPYFVLLCFALLGGCVKSR